MSTPRNAVRKKKLRQRAATGVAGTATTRTNNRNDDHDYEGGEKTHKQRRNLNPTLCFFLLLIGVVGGSSFGSFQLWVHQIQQQQQEQPVVAEDNRAPPLKTQGVEVGSSSSSSKGEDLSSSSSSVSKFTTWEEMILPRIDKNAKRSWEVMGEKKRPLNFVHIPKTGGSSVIEAAIVAGLNWGDCLFAYKYRSRRCPWADAANANNPWPGNDPTPLGRVWWHVPPQFLPTTITTDQNTDVVQLPNPYEGQDLFAIIRNPYERAVSEFYYNCEIKPDQCKGIWTNRQVAVNTLNRKIQNGIKHTWKGTTAGGGGETGNNPQYYFRGGHWIPQYDYFVLKANNSTTTTTTSQKPQHIIQHVLHTETLQDDFLSLLKAYELDNTVGKSFQQFGKFKSRQDHNFAEKRPYTLGVQNLTVATLEMVEDFYRMDFELGNYPMISKFLKAKQQ